MHSVYDNCVFVVNMLLDALVELLPLCNPHKAQLNKPHQPGRKIWAGRVLRRDYDNFRI